MYKSRGGGLAGEGSARVSLCSLCLMSGLETFVLVNGTTEGLCHSQFDLLITNNNKSPAFTLVVLPLL